MTPKHILYIILGIVYIFLTYKFWTVIAPIDAADKTALESIFTVFYWITVAILSIISFIFIYVIFEDLHKMSNRKVSEVVIGLIIIVFSGYLAITYKYWTYLNNIDGEHLTGLEMAGYVTYWVSSSVIVYIIIHCSLVFMSKKDRWNKKLW